MAKNMISAGSPHTVEAGKKIMENGGNAVDAAVGATLASCVCETSLTSFFGGGIATVYSNTKKEVYTLNFCPTAPSNFGNEKTRDFLPLLIQFGDTSQYFHIGNASAAVPGSPMGLFQLHQRYGRISLDNVCSPAKDFAENGFYITEFYHHAATLLKDILSYSEVGRKAWLKQNGELKKPGETMRFPGYAKLLEKFGQEGSDFFYHSNWVKNLCQNFSSNGGILSFDDFKSYSPVWEPSLPIAIGEDNVWVPPTDGGVLVGFCLGMMELLKEQGPNCFSYIFHYLNIHRPEILTTFLKEKDLILEKALKQIKIWIDKEKVDPDNSQMGSPIGDTTHVSVVDNEGNACSITTSAGEGNGTLVPDFQVMFNNFMGEEDLHPQGFFKGQPGVRLSSMMSPAIGINRQNKEVSVVLGSGGANRIRTAIAQVLGRFYFAGSSIEDAVDAPRLHVDGGTIFFEPNCDSQNKIPEGLLLEPFSRPHMFFGGVHSVAPGQQKAQGDPRRGGETRVF